MSFDRHTKVLSGVEAPQFYHPNLTVGEFFLHYLRRDAFRVVQTNHDDGFEITAGEMAQLGCQTAAGLLNIIKYGDVVGVVAKNTNNVAPLMLGCFLAGTPPSTVDHTFGPKDIAHIFNMTKPKIVFCDGDIVDVVKEGLKICEIECEVLTIDETVIGTRYWTDILETPEKSADFVPKRSNIESSKVCAAILCSSGTTGLSKGVMLSHTQCMGMTKAGSIFATLFCFSSLYWYSGFSGLMQSLANNINRVISKHEFSPELLVEIVEKNKVNALVTPPAQLALLLKSEAIKTADLSTVWINMLTGGPMDVSLRREYQKYLKNGSIVMTYATTEVGSIISSTAPFEEVSNSCGKPSANTKVKVIDDDGCALDALQVGEICVLYPFNFLGYINNPDDTDKAYDKEGWLKTGDLGYITEDGQVVYTDRKKEVYDHMNYTVYPSEIESWIAKMKGVKAVCVVGIRDLTAGCLGAAVVVKDFSSSITEKEIVDEIENNFLTFKRLHGGAYFVDALPMTSSGKIKRLAAREIAEKRFAERHLEN